MSEPAAPGVRVVNEILFMEPTEDGIRYLRVDDDLSRRRDVVEGRTLISTAVQQIVDKRFPALLDAANRPHLVVHSTSWHQHDDGSIRLSWVVTSPALHLETQPGSRILRGDQLRAGIAPQSSKPDSAAVGERAVAVHAAQHVAFLAQRDPDVRRALGDAATLARWTAIPGRVAGNVEPPKRLRGSAARGRDSLWRVGCDIFSVAVGRSGADYVVDRREVDGRTPGAVRMGESVAEAFAAHFPGQPVDASTIVQSTSWRQAEDGSLRLHWMVVPRHLDLRGVPGVHHVEIGDAAIQTSGDAAAPDAVKHHPSEGIVSHGLENLGYQALTNPGVASALEAVPGRLALLQGMNLLRREQHRAPDVEREVA